VQVGLGGTKFDFTRAEVLYFKYFIINSLTENKTLRFDVEDEESKKSFYQSA
jgi:hypothetical protein